MLICNFTIRLCLFSNPFFTFETMSFIKLKCLKVSLRIGVLVVCRIVLGSIGMSCPNNLINLATSPRALRLSLFLAYKKLSSCKMSISFSVSENEELLSRLPKLLSSVEILSRINCAGGGGSQTSPTVLSQDLVFCEI